MSPRNQPTTIKEFQNTLFNSYANVKRCAQAYWRSYNGKVWEISEKAKKQLRVDIINLVTAMKNVYNLSKEDSDSLLGGLDRLGSELTHTSTPQWDITLEDIELVCERPNLANLLADALLNFKGQGIFDAEKLALLRTGDKTFFSNYKAYQRINFIGHGEVGSHAIPLSLKKYLFTRVINSFASEEECKSSVISKYQTELNNISEQASNKIFRIKKTDLTQVITIFRALKKEDHGDILKNPHDCDDLSIPVEPCPNPTSEQIDNIISETLKKINTNTSIDAFKEVINLYDEAKLEAKTIFLQPEQFIFILRVLYAACMPYVKKYGGFDDSDDYELPKTRPEQIIQYERDNANKVIAKQLLNHLLGQERAIALWPLWKAGKFYPVFDLPVLMRFFVIDKNQAASFAASILLFWSDQYIFCRPSLVDLDYLCLFLKNNISQTTTAENTELLSQNVDDDGQSYSTFYVKDELALRYPVLILAAGLHWLSHHRINTPDNKDRLFDLKNHSVLLTCINISNYSRDEKEVTAESKKITQQLFTMILDGIQLIKNRSLGLTTKTNPAVHNILKKKGLFSTNNDRKESFRNATEMGRAEYQAYVNRKY